MTELNGERFIGGPTDRFMPKRIPTGWRWVRLTDVCELETGHTPARDMPAYWDGEIGWVSLHDTDSLDDPEISKTAYSTTPAGIANSSARLLPKGTVIFSRTATVGKATVLADEMATSQDFMNYVCGKEISSTYLMYALRSMGRTWHSIMAGSTHSTIYKSDFENLHVLLPPLPEQNRIAGIISDWNYAISRLDELIPLKRQRHMGLIQQMLSGKLRLRGYEGKWKRVALGDVSTLCSGGTPSKQNPSYWGGDIPWVSAKDLKTFVLSDSIDHVTSQAVGNGTRLVEEGSILILVRGMTLLKSVPVCVAGVPMCFNQDIRVAKAHDVVDERFLAYSIVASEKRLLSLVNVSGHGTGRLSTDELKELALKIPPTKEEQRAIRDVLDRSIEELALLGSKVSRMKKQRNHLMQQLLTGKIRVKIPEGVT